MRDEIQKAASAAFHEVAGTAGPVEAPRQPPPAQPEQNNDRYAITPEKEQYIRTVAQIAAEERARNLPDADERMMRLRERVALEEADNHRNRKEAAEYGTVSHRAKEILSQWMREEVNGFYDKQREILNDHFSRSVSELRFGQNKSYDQRKAELQQAYAEAGVAGKPPRLTDAEYRARFQQALQIAHMELSGQQ
jgi:hypothetical protein